MKCPHCNIGIHARWQDLFSSTAGDIEHLGFSLRSCECPECKRFFFEFERRPKRKSSVKGEGRSTRITFGGVDPQPIRVLIHPFHVTRPVPPEVPDPYRTDYQEAAAVLPVSPKASAALSRRNLQGVLVDECKVGGKDLSKQIDAFIGQPGVPADLRADVDAVRNVGNFAAHPIKYQHTGDIVPVEPAEAEWLLDVLDRLFDHVFVQPVEAEARRQRLNGKLTAAGKPQLKA